MPAKPVAPEPHRPAARYLTPGGTLDAARLIGDLVATEAKDHRRRATLVGVALAGLAIALGIGTRRWASPIETAFASMLLTYSALVASRLVADVLAARAQRARNSDAELRARVQGARRALRDLLEARETRIDTALALVAHRPPRRRPLRHGPAPHGLSWPPRATRWRTRRHADTLERELLDAAWNAQIGFAESCQITEAVEGRTTPDELAERLERLTHRAAEATSHRVALDVLLAAGTHERVPARSELVADVFATLDALDRLGHRAPEVFEVLATAREHHDTTVAQLVAATADVLDELDDEATQEVFCGLAPDWGGTVAELVATARRVTGRTVTCTESDTVTAPLLADPDE